MVPGDGFEPPTRGFSILFESLFLNNNFINMLRYVAPLSNAF